MSTENPYAQLPAGAGPDGGTLLGFLASVGALVAFTRVYARKRVTLHWQPSLGWRGRVLIDQKLPSKENFQELHRYLTSRIHHRWYNLTVSTWVGDPKKKRSRYENPDQVSTADCLLSCGKAVYKHGPKSREIHDRFASMFSPFHHDDAKWVSGTKLCALGSSKQYFFEHARQLSQSRIAPILAKGGKVKNQTTIDRDTGTAVSDLERTLLDRWTNPDFKPGMRWEAAEDRHHALRHLEPDKSKITNLIRTQRGANRLGIEAMACFPVIPGSRRAETTGFRYDKEVRRHQFTWPIWDCPLTLESVRVLVAHSELAEGKPSHRKLLSLGVSSVFRTTRVTKDKGQVSFTIANAV